MVRTWIFLNLNKRHDSKLIGIVEGDKKSIAARMIYFLENKAKNYPFRNRYKKYPGPNSNTFIQWMLNKFDNCGFKLPRNALGKNWKGIKN